MENYCVDDKISSVIQALLSDPGVQAALAYAEEDADSGDGWDHLHEHPADSADLHAGLRGERVQRDHDHLLHRRVGHGKKCSRIYHDAGGLSPDGRPDNLFSGNCGRICG